MSDVSAPDQAPGELPSAPATASEPVIATCPNCQAEINGPYCAACGQLQKNLNRQVWSLAGELLEDVLRLDSRLWRTLFGLFFKPGFLTTEYFDGRRARYTPPIRLYLVISFIFFFLLPNVSSIGPDLNIRTDGDEVAAEAGITVEEDDNDVSVDGLELPWLTPEENEENKHFLEEQIEKARHMAQDDPAALFAALMDQMSVVMFFMLPLFAMFLKVMYIGSGVYYAEHLLLAVHNHCFLFITLLLTALMDALGRAATGIEIITGLLDDLVMLWVVAYMFLSLRNTYGQGYFVTSLKFIILVIIYFVLTLIGIIAASLIGVWNL